MSTSDPDRPADDTTEPAVEETTPPADEKQTVAADETPTVSDDAPAVSDETPAAPVEPAPAPVVEPAPVADAKPVAEPAAAVAPVEKPAEAVAADVEPERAGVEPVVATPVEPSPVTGTLAAVDPAEPAGLDTGRHAVVRPTPVPPDEPEPAPVVAAPVAPVAPVEPVVDPAVAAVGAASVAAPAATYAAITPEPDDDGRLFPDPNAPSSPSVGSRVLGIIVGLILAPIAVGIVLLGESQILEAQVDGWDATTSVFGIVLVTLGLLLLGCVLLLGLWTATVPITGGVVLTAAGAFYLYAPSIARDQTLNVLTSSGWRLTITQVTVSATSGMVLAVGFLLLLAGIVIASARKRGVHLGEFRERHKV